MRSHRREKDNINTFRRKAKIICMSRDIWQSSPSTFQKPTNCITSKATEFTNSRLSPHRERFILYCGARGHTRYKIIKKKIETTTTPATTTGKQKKSNEPIFFDSVSFLLRPAELQSVFACELGAKSFIRRVVCGRSRGRRVRRRWGRAGARGERSWCLMGTDSLIIHNQETSASRRSCESCENLIH